MLNIIFFLVILPLVIVEFYKIICWNNCKNMLYFLKKKKHITYNYLSLLIFLFIHTTNNFQYNTFKYTLCIYFFVLFFNFFFRKHYYNLFFLILVLMTNILYLKNNIAYFILFVELITLFLFFFIFLDFYKNNKNYKLSIIVFFLNNFIVFLFGIILITVLYIKYGTSNLTVVFIKEDTTVKILVYLFFFVKLQQCFIFLLNLRYYAISTPKNIFLYKLPYFITIWIYLFFILINFKLTPVYNISIVLLYSSFFLFNFLNYFNKWNDFFIFSTWLLLLFQIFFIII